MRGSVDKAKTKKTQKRDQLTNPTTNECVKCCGMQHPLSRRCRADDSLTPRTALNEVNIYTHVGVCVCMCAFDGTTFKLGHRHSQQSKQQKFTKRTTAKSKTKCDSLPFMRHATYARFGQAGACAQRHITS